MSTIWLNARNRLRGMKFPWRKWLWPFSKTQWSLLISLIALCVSVTQFYFSNLHKLSSLTAFVSSFVVTASNHVDENGNIRFDAVASITVALTNVGNAPSTLLKIFYVTPQQGLSCEEANHLDWDFFGSQRFGSGKMVGVAFSNLPQVVPPGATIVSEGEMKLLRAMRQKDLIGHGREICLMFVVLDHKGTPFVNAVNAGTFSVSQNSSGQSYSSDLKMPIDLIKR